VCFTQAYAHTVCCPARAMLMTGRYPHSGRTSTRGCRAGCAAPRG
jgi:arylsulfatase A-like enzyme